MPLCTLESIDGLPVVTFQTPVLSEAALAELCGALDALSSQPGRPPVIVRSAHPTIFLAGAHLAEIAALDRTTSAVYARRGRAALDRLAAMAGPTIAAVHGSCSGGGFDLVLACDRIVAGAGASFGHPGVLRGLVTGWGGTVRLPRAAGSPLARLALIAAEPLTAADLAARGAAVTAGADHLGAAIAEARRLAGVHPERLAAWRALRGRGAPSARTGQGL